MPIYEVHCLTHGHQEYLSPSVSSDDQLPCPVCGILGDRELSLVSMQPDRFWHNNNVMGTQVNSMNEYRELRNRLEPATRDKQESIGKRRIKLEKERQEKAGDKLEKFLANELAAV